MANNKRLTRVLHLASFAGNIGDLANHAGARKMMAETLGLEIEVVELEIREFYWKQRYFDEAFVDYANGFDLLIVGGGNYFELWVDHSATGTSIDLPPDLLARLTVPTLFFALGVDTGQGYSEKSARNFQAFMETVLARKDMFVCVRNDGSSKALHEVLRESIATRIPVMPDCGFFAGRIANAIDRPKSNRLGINIAGDMLERRFDRSLDTDGFLGELASALERLLDASPELTIDLMPHIWRDSVLIARLLSIMPDRHLRRRVNVGRLEPTAAGLPDFIERYSQFDMVLGMRFHANVCPIGMGVPARGLLNYPQVELLYQELDMPDRLIDVRVAGFGEQLLAHVLSDLGDLQAQRQLSKQTADRLEQQARKTFSAINAWLQKNLD